MSADFTLDQKRYLEGFAAGFSAHGGQRTTPQAPESAGPDSAHTRAQDRVKATGGKLTDQEKWKREEHPFDAYPRLVAQAKQNTPPNTAQVPSPTEAMACVPSFSTQ